MDLLMGTTGHNVNLTHGAVPQELLTDSVQKLGCGLPVATGSKMHAMHVLFLRNKIAHVRSRANNLEVE